MSADQSTASANRSSAPAATEVRIDAITGHRAVVVIGDCPPAEPVITSPPAHIPADAALRANVCPALTEDAPTPPAEANRDLFWAAPARGTHEVIVNSDRPADSLASLTVEECATAVDVWRERMQAHAEAPCRHLVINEGAGAGAAQRQTHANLYALDFVPALIARERERFGAYATRTMGGNLLADLVQEEVRRRERIVAIDSEAVLIAPYGSRFPFQLMLAPRTPRPNFETQGPTGAALLHNSLTRLISRFGTRPELNIWVRTAPSGAEHFCWRIDIVPRLTHVSGLELGTGVSLNPVAPERAAAELRDV